MNKEWTQEYVDDSPENPAGKRDSKSNYLPYLFTLQLVHHHHSLWSTRVCSIHSLLTSLTPSPAKIPLFQFAPATLAPLSGTILKEIKMHGSQNEYDSLGMNWNSQVPSSIKQKWYYPPIVLWGLEEIVHVNSSVKHWVQSVNKWLFLNVFVLSLYLGSYRSWQNGFHSPPLPKL